MLACLYLTETNTVQPSLFQKGGITDPKSANLATGGVGIALFLSSWIPIFYFDRLGRKTWLQIGTVGMMLSMLGIAGLQQQAEQHPGSDGNYIIILFPYLFYIFFNVSWGVAAWTYPSEIFPLSMRAKGNALATSANWASCYVVAQVSPVLGDVIGWGLYVVYALICVAAFAFVRFALGTLTLLVVFVANWVIVETKDRSLEDMNELFGLESYFSTGDGAKDDQVGLLEGEQSLADGE